MMKMSMKHKRILGLVFTIFITLFSISPVVAKEKCNAKYTEAQIVKRYGAKIKEGAVANKFVITINPKSSNATVKAQLRKVVFKVTKINGKNVESEGMTVSYKNKLDLQAELVDDDGEKSLEVEMKAIEKDIDPGCTGHVTLVVSISKMGNEIITKEPVTSVDDYETDMIGKWAINCDKVNYDKNTYENNLSFEQRFCYSKMKALASTKYDKNKNNIENARNFAEAFNYGGTFTGTTGKLDNKKGKEIEGIGNKTFKNINKGKSIELKCDYNSFYKPENLKYTSKTEKEADHAKDLDKYYKESNRSYVYGSGVVTKNFEQYVYHYSPEAGGNTGTENVSCKVRCEEAVVVEYGPPVASKAGLCFEYKIKVTSRVSCDLAEKVKKPNVPSEYCTPTPVCTNGRGGYWNQGGPNEDFDNCVKACDGGKYTEKCSNKCYQKVYGTKGLTKTTTSLYNSSNLELLAVANMSLVDCKEYSTDGGCYYRDGTGIHWSGGPADGRWYRISAHKDLSEYIIGADGIYRHRYKDGSICDDTCWWAGCENTNMYLNPGIAQHDKEHNMKIYETAVAECKAAAKCTTDTAEFKIETNYSHYTSETKKETVTVSFPKETGVDRITSGLELEQGKNQITKDKKDTSIMVVGGSNEIKSNNGDLITGTGRGNGKGYAGCYRDGQANNWYQTEWSFPGTWINNKTGEISYIRKDENTGWQAYEDKVCLPINAQPVNQRWWNHYYNSVFKNTDSSVTSESFTSNCKSVETSVNKPGSKIKDGDIKWNINGFATKFGFFEWDFNIKCFYALNEQISGSSDKDGNSNEDKCETPPPYNDEKKSSYVIRTVDLKNVFPDKNGGSNNRTPGFNWSQYAENTKNSKYTSNPQEYLKEVQTKNYTIYSDSYLDYEFELTPEKLSKMRKEGKKYTDFEGKVDVKEGITVYESKAIRDLSNKVPSKSSLCNNLKNYRDGCNK